MPVVNVENVSMKFRLPSGERITAIQDLNLQVPDCSFTVLTGHSGSGKTTLLRLIAGLEKPIKGSVSIDGKAPTLGSKDAPQVAMVFQEPALYSHLSVKENLIFPLMLRKASRSTIDQRASELEKLLNLDGLLNREPETLSGGQKQRVALGRALASNAQVLLLDEPFSNLDSSARAELRRELGQLQRKLGLTVIYVTHDQSEALAHADQLCVMNGGRLIQAATPREIYGEPNSIFVARFFGIPPINLFEGALTRDGDAYAVKLNAFTLKVLQSTKLAFSKFFTGGAASIPVKIGVRPEAFTLDGQGVIGAQLRTLEYQGDRSFALWDSQIGPVQSCLPEPSPPLEPVGKKLSIRGAVHLFDSITQERITSFRHEPC